MAMLGEIAQAGQFLSGLVSNTGTRMSDEHFREGINRSNLFLEGTTPTNAAMYNQYQDATYGKDSQRQADRIKLMGSELGMSPWELTGNSTNTSPVQSFGEGKPQDTQFLSQQMPLKIAEMQARTQLANTFLQTQTQKEINEQNTVGGELPRQQRIESAARTVAANASSERDWQNITLDMARMMLDASPRETMGGDIMGLKYQREGRSGMTAVRNFITETQDSKGELPLSAAMAGLNTDAAERVANGLKRMAEQLLDSGPNAGKAIDKALNDAGQFLGNMTKKK